MLCCQPNIRDTHKLSDDSDQSQWYPPDIFRGKKVPGNSPECANHKREQLLLLRCIFLWFAQPGLGSAVFSPAPPSRCSYPRISQRLSGSIHDRSGAQVWNQGDFSPNTCQSRWPYQLYFAHSTLLVVVNAHTTSYIVSNAFWEILCHVFVFTFLCRLSAAIDNMLYTFGSLPTQPAQWWISFSINRVLNKNCPYALLLRWTDHIPSVPFSKKPFQNHVKDSRSVAYWVSCETSQCKTFSF